MDSFDRTIRYIFIISLVLVGVAYYVGSTNLLNSIFSGTNSLILTTTGRTANGTFAGYAK